MSQQSDALSTTGGYTLLEVMLFLAISSALALIAFLGLGPRLRNVRFTDATRALQSDIVREFSSTQAGVNRRPDNFLCSYNSTLDGPKVEAKNDVATGSSGDCIINGKLVELGQNSATYYSIISLRTPRPADPTNNCNNNDFSEITDCFKPTIQLSGSPTGPSVQNYKNGMQASSSLTPVYYGYLQDPNGTNKHYFFYNSLPSTKITSSDATLSGTKDVCLSLSGRKAILTLSTNTLQPELKSEGCGP